MHKEDLALNNLQWLICHKTQPTDHSESKVLQYFGYVRHNLAVPAVFTKVLNVTKQTGLWDAKLAWYSQRATC